MKFVEKAIGLIDETLFNSINLFSNSQQIIITALNSQSQPFISQFTEKFSDFIQIPGRVRQLIGQDILVSIGFDSKLYVSYPPYVGWATLNILASKLHAVSKSTEFHIIYSYQCKLFDVILINQQGQQVFVKSQIDTNVDESNIILSESKQQLTLYYKKSDGQILKRVFTNSWSEQKIVRGKAQQLAYNNELIMFNGQILETDIVQYFSYIDEVLCYVNQTGNIQIGKQIFGLSQSQIKGIKFKGNYYFVYINIDGGIRCIMSNEDLNELDLDLFF
ncbi:hypothetical protein SS50377_24489 [Spironucleus salmonicida]|uniref:Uncharacterized protein n=1 Tax=Spironucleus salmonicida TaxID=348837 RepID=V6LQI5_9EUKA|nr:hypothetical protein SS50377_24489 [Spironucleus salmonicida]|eukprot:EST45966.1 Hypothetical protein SS50377_13945 [Spironucleus salmonicida]